MIDVLRRVAWFLVMVVTTPLWSLLMVVEMLSTAIADAASWLRTGAVSSRGHEPWLLDWLFAQIDRIKP